MASGQWINTDDLEAISDALLKKHGAARDKECPAYVEKYLIAREQRRGEVSIDDVYEQAAPIPEASVHEAIFDIDRKELKDACHKVGLTCRQIDIIQLFQTLHTPEEVAEVTGWSKRTVIRDMRRAYKLIHKLPTFGMRTVIAEEMRMHIGVVRDILGKSNQSKCHQIRIRTGC